MSYIAVPDELGMYDESAAYEAEIQSLQMQYQRRIAQEGRE